MENNTQQYSVSLEKLVEQVKALREQEQSLAKQQEALNKAFKEGKITEQQYANANNRLSLQIQATRQKITQTANATKSLAQTAKQSKSEMDDYGQTINGVGDALGRLGEAPEDISARFNFSASITHANTHLNTRVLHALQKT